MQQDSEEKGVVIVVLWWWQCDGGVVAVTEGQLTKSHPVRVSL